MNRILVALISGALFGLGLAISRMTDPTVVLGFLDLFGDFNPALAFVLGGAVGTTTLAFRFILRRNKPVLESEFKLSTACVIDQKLLLGAAIFCVGWGLAGYCPGPALVGVAGGVSTAIIFLPAMLVGALLHAVVRKKA
jgi:uncharacterized membrane protein YedE/YeeE